MCYFAADMAMVTGRMSQACLYTSRLPARKYLIDGMICDEAKIFASWLDVACFGLEFLA